MEVKIESMINNRPTLGGHDVLVQLDEYLFSHKQKYNIGRHANKQQWVFGIGDTLINQTSNTHMQTKQMEDQSKETLLGLIMWHVKRGSLFHSDC